MYIRQSRSVNTTYIALFTCAITCVLHLEVISDLLTDKFLMALLRFVTRRGLLHTIHIDNATAFQAMSKELVHIWDVLFFSKIQQYYTHQGITWNFIAPRAPWWKGWWERMIGSVKRCLRKVLGKARIDEDGLLTVLAGIEATLNSRPIIHEYGLGELGKSLTPAHFLNGKKLTTIPSSPEPVNKSLMLLWQEKQRRIDSSWKRWCKEYLLDLRSYHEICNI